MEEKSENIVKKVCRELGLTYRELGERIGYSEEAVSKASRTDEISKPMAKALELMIELEQKKEDLKTLEILKTTLNALLNRK